MKYIIEFPEDYYKAIKEIPIKQSTTDMLIIRNGTPLSEELEKIKKEVEEEKIDIDLNIGQERLYNNAINDVMQIIDNHISELKGEQE